MDIAKLIKDERARQDELHGEENAKTKVLDYKWIAVIAEELGEASQALDYIKRHAESANDVYDVLIPEIVQVAALCHQWLERLGTEFEF
jgi:hypothetical protein